MSPTVPFHPQPDFVTLRNFSFSSLHIHLKFELVSPSVLKFLLPVFIFLPDTEIGALHKVEICRSQCHLVLLTLNLFLKSFFMINTFRSIYLQLHWVFVAVWGFSLVVGVGGLLSAALCRLLIVVKSCCSKVTLGAHVSIVEIHWLSCSTARGIFLDQGSNSRLLHW